MAGFKRLACLLADYFEAKGLGSVTSGSGIWLQTKPDTALAPDVAVFLGEPSAAVDEIEGYERRVPALVVEIISPSDSFSLVEESKRSLEMSSTGRRRQASLARLSIERGNGRSPRDDEHGCPERTFIDERDCSIK
jgi:Putative restriction endonuclease